MTTTTITNHYDPSSPENHPHGSRAAAVVASSQQQSMAKKAKQKTANRARHRLRSIHRDAQTIDSIRDQLAVTVPSAHSWPIVANERCGSWYVPPPSTTPSNSSSPTVHSSCYFKSTDGHVGTWAFSLKRLNGHLLEYLFTTLHDDGGMPGGCIVVDSSLRKLLPDSCSRTIPIWAAVINKVVLRYRHDFGIMHSSNNLDDWDTSLYTPSEIVSNEEHDTIVALLEERVETLYQSRAIVDPRRLVEQLTKPIRPLWITNTNNNCSESNGTGLGHDDSLSLSSLESSSAVLSNVANDYFWIICVNPSTYCFKSNRKQSITWHGDQVDCPYATSDDKNGEKDNDAACHRASGFYYLPGAGDDEESWARHLTPALFWSHIEDLIDPSLTEDDVDSRIDTLVTLAKSRTDDEEEGESPVERRLDDPFSDQIGDLSLWIGSRRSGRPPGCWHHFDAILNVTNQEYEGMDEGNRVAVRVEQRIDEEGNGNNTGRFYMQLPVAEGKRDKTELERWMPCGLLFLVVHLQQHRRVLVHCNQGKDRSVAIVLAFLVVACNLNFPPSIINELYGWDTTWAVERMEEDDGCRSGDYNDISGFSKSVIQRLSQDDGREEILKWIHAQRQDNTTLLLQPIADKERLRIALHLILQYRSKADPTRSTLQKLNRFFMSSPLYRKS